MKNLILIFSLIAFSFSLCIAQPHIIINKGGGSGGGIPPFPHDSTKYLRGDSSWQTAGVGGSLWYANQSGNPILNPSVTNGTKGLAAGDSAIANGFHSLSFGEAVQANGKYSIALGSNSASFITKANSYGTINIGGGSEANVADSNNAAGGQNTIVGFHAQAIIAGIQNSIFGATATVAASGLGNVAIGYAARCGNSNACANSIAIGNNSRTNDTSDIAIGFGSRAGSGTGALCNIAIGANAGYNISVHNHCGDISSYAQTLSGSSSELVHDSAWHIGCGKVTSKNTNVFFIGGGNDQTQTNTLFAVSNGGKDGNPSQFDAINLTKQGTLTIAQNLILPAPTIPANSSDTGVTGQVTWDSGFIYICVDTNTWKRVAIATW